MNFVQGTVPDYSNTQTTESRKKFGKYEFKEKLNDGVKVENKMPVELDSQAIYIGEWAKDEN